LDVVDPRFAALWDRARAVLEPDPRVREVRIHGSIATGTADAWSDLDVQVIATEDGFEPLLADWPSWLAEITPTVFARTPIAPFVVNTVTADGLTFDLSIWKGQPPAFPPPSGWAVGLLSGQRFDDVGLALEYAVAEQLRGMAGPFISLVKRGEHLRHLTGVPHLLGLLTTVFLAELDAPMPAKHWNRTFTEEQLAAVAALPPVAAPAEALTAFGLACSELLVTRARPELARRGLPGPSELAAVPAARVHDQLGIDTTRWLF
jgi:hypothetical protein